jgi:hypothetical protein
MTGIGQGAAACCRFDLLGHGRAEFSLATDYDNIATRFGQSLDHGSPQAFGCAGYQRDASRQVESIRQ